jgi:hypothetical protein
MANRLTSGMSAMGAAQSIDPFLQAQTVFSGADPALADLAGTSAITQGTYPQSSNTAFAASWLSANPWSTPTPSSNLVSGPTGSSSTTSALPAASATTTVVVFVVAIVLLMAGAFALVGPEISGAAG